MVTDLAEVNRLGTAKGDENVAFRRYLADHHCSDKPFQIIANEVQQHVDCTACANCCRHSLVTLTEADVDRMANYLGMTREAVLQRYTEADPDRASQRILRSNHAGCIFLNRNLCGIYAARPQACHDFPHVAVGSHSLGGRQSSHARWASLCPIIYNALEEYKHHLGWHPAH